MNGRIKVRFSDYFSEEQDILAEVDMVDVPRDGESVALDGQLFMVWHINWVIQDGALIGVLIGLSKIRS